MLTALRRIQGYRASLVPERPREPASAVGARVARARMAKGRWNAPGWEARFTLRKRLRGLLGAADHDEPAEE